MMTSSRGNTFSTGNTAGDTVCLLRGQWLSWQVRWRDIAHHFAGLPHVTTIMAGAAAMGRRCRPVIAAGYANQP
jgi:hypothetical protein